MEEIAKARNVRNNLGFKSLVTEAIPPQVLNSLPMSVEAGSAGSITQDFLNVTQGIQKTNLSLIT